MIIGIGTDILHVRRIEEAMERTPGFESRVFAREETEYCRRMHRAGPHFAARFCAKEAFMKALSTGWSGGIRFQDIVVLRAESGAPYLEIREPTRSLIPDFERLLIHVTLSHDQDIAIASVIIERMDAV